MTLDDMQLTIRSKLNDLRALDRIVHSVQFQECLKSDPNNKQLSQAIREGDIEFIRDWINDILEKEICEFSVKQLRAIASQLGLKNYTGFTKDELLVQIMQVKNEFAKAENASVSMPYSSNGHQAIS